MGILDQLKGGGGYQLAGLLSQLPSFSGRPNVAQGMGPALFQMGQQAREDAKRQKLTDSLRGVIGNQTIDMPMAGPLRPGESRPTQAVTQQGTGLLSRYPAAQRYVEGLISAGQPEAANQFIGGLMSKSIEAGFEGKENEFKHADKLRDEFNKGATEFQKVSDAYGRVIASVDKPDAAGDMALIFNYMKMLDPGSTVREGEYATAQSATGVPSQVLNLYNRIVSGERLNPAQRQEFFGRSQKLYGSALGGLEQLENQYTGLANRFGVDPQNVIVDYRVDRAIPDLGVGGETGAPAPAGAQQQDSRSRLEELRRRQGG